MDFPLCKPRSLLFLQALIRILPQPYASKAFRLCAGQFHNIFYYLVHKHPKQQIFIFINHPHFSVLVQKPPAEKPQAALYAFHGCLQTTRKCTCFFLFGKRLNGNCFVHHLCEVFFCHFFQNAVQFVKKLCVSFFQRNTDVDIFV